MLPRRHTFVEDDHTNAEYEELRNRLEVLSSEQLSAVANCCGISFVESQRSLAKEDYMNVMDECYWDELAEAFEDVTGRAW
jgi:hypothetical protein